VKIILYQIHAFGEKIGYVSIFGEVVSKRIFSDRQEAINYIPDFRRLVLTPSKDKGEIRLRETNRLEINVKELELVVQDEDKWLETMMNIFS